MGRQVVVRSLWWGVGVGLLVVAACGDEAEPGAAGVPTTPAACAGPGSSVLEEDRLAQWSAASAALNADPGARVWLSFNEALTVEQAGEYLRPLTAHAVMIVYEQRQGTYLKGLDQVPDVAVDDPAFGEAARTLTAQNLGIPNRLPVGGADAFEPVDPSVAAGEPPIVGVLVTGDVERVLHERECLVFGLMQDLDGMLPPIAPSIEPEMPIPDRG